MKKVLSILATTLLTLCLAVVVACTPKPSADKTVESIKVDSSNAKTMFFVDETFAYNGLVVTAVYSDKSEDTVTGYVVAPPDMTSAGEKDVTVSYKQKTTTYKISVSEKALTGITLNTDETARSFRVGDTFSYDGLVVTATYDDGSSKAVTGYTVSTPDLSATGEKEVTVTFEGKTAIYKIKVVEAEAEAKLVDISVALEKNYVEKNGQLALTVTAKYDVGGNKTLTDSEYTLTADLTKIGESEIVVKYADFTKTAKVWVVPAEADLFNTLELTAEGSATALTLYLDEFDRENGRGTGNGSASNTKGWYFFTLEDGTHYMTTFECDHKGAAGGWGTDFKSGDESVTVRFVTEDGDKHDYLHVAYNNVNYYAETNLWHARVLDWTYEARAVSIDGLATSYQLNGTFTTEGAVINGNLKSGETKDITASCTFTAEQPDMTAIGGKNVKFTITYTYEDYGTTRTQELTAMLPILVMPEEVKASDVINFTAVGAETLQLYVTERTGGKNTATDGTAKGLLIYRGANGYKNYPFEFSYTATQTTRAMTLTGEGATATFVDDESLNIAIGETVFTVSGTLADTILLGLTRETTGIDWLASNIVTVGTTAFTPVLNYSDGGTETLTADKFTVNGDLSAQGVAELVFTYPENTAYNATIKVFCVPQTACVDPILDFGADRNGSAATLKLYITERTGDGNPMHIKGLLLLVKADGTMEIDDYSFDLLEWWMSRPYPNGNPQGTSADGKITSEVPAGGTEFGDGLVVRYVAEGYNFTFAAMDGNWWHHVVLGW